MQDSQCATKAIRSTRNRGNPGEKGRCALAWSHQKAAELLATSTEMSPGERYATSGGVAFSGKEHRPGVWHGYPIGWVEVPPKLIKLWQSEQRVSKRQIRDNWEQAKRSLNE